MVTSERHTVLLLTMGMLLLVSCEPTHIYHGKEVCQLITNQDVAEIFHVPFEKGVRTGNLNFDEDYVGSTCSFDSVAKWNPKQPKFRVVITVEYAPPAETSLDAKRAAWAKDRYNGMPFYTGIHEVSGVADVALAALDYNKTFDVWSILKPSTKIEVGVMGVAPAASEAVAVAVARKTASLVREENAPAPTPRSQ
jgi:hypothetical protein